MFYVMSALAFGCTAALINFAFLTHAVLSTDEVVKAMEYDGAKEARRRRLCQPHHLWGRKEA